MPASAAGVETARNTIGDNRATANNPPSIAVATSSAGVVAGPAHNVAAASSLTSPPPIHPRENNSAPVAKTAAAQSTAPALPEKEMAGADASCSGQSAHRPSTIAFGITSRRTSSTAAANINPANPAR